MNLAVMLRMAKKFDVVVIIVVHAHVLWHAILACTQVLVMCYVRGRTASATAGACVRPS